MRNLSVHPGAVNLIAPNFLWCLFRVSVITCIKVKNKQVQVVHEYVSGEGWMK